MSKNKPLIFRYLEKNDIIDVLELLNNLSNKNKFLFFIS
jgi:hypothetical protein